MFSSDGLDGDLTVSRRRVLETGGVLAGSLFAGVAVGRSAAPTDGGTPPEQPSLVLVERRSSECTRSGSRFVTSLFTSVPESGVISLDEVDVPTITSSFDPESVRVADLTGYGEPDYLLGERYLFYGPVSGDRTLSDADAELSSAANDIAVEGDVTGDGIPDLGSQLLQRSCSSVSIVAAPYLGFIPSDSHYHVWTIFSLRV